jgi:hypothetical protein
MLHRNYCKRQFLINTKNQVMKVVHYEYRLKDTGCFGPVEIELVAKKIKHYSDVMDITSSGDIIRRREPRELPVAPGRSKNIASRYYFGTKVNQQRKQPIFPAAKTPLNSDEYAANCVKVSWRTSLKK